MFKSVLEVADIWMLRSPIFEDLYSQILEYLCDRCVFSVLDII